MSGDDSSSVKAAGKSSAGILHPVLASLLKDGHKADQKLKEPAAGMVLSLLAVTVQFVFSVCKVLDE